MKLEFIFPEKTIDEQKSDFLHDLQADTSSMDNAPEIIECEYSIFEKIRNWALNKGIYTYGDPKTQTLKLVEEVGELSKAILNKNIPEISDAIGDCVIVLTSVATLCGLSIEKCIEQAYEVIQSRTGKMENGTFIKD